MNETIVAPVYMPRCMNCANDEIEFWVCPADADCAHEMFVVRCSTCGCGIIADSLELAIDAWYRKLASHLNFAMPVKENWKKYEQSQIVRVDPAFMVLTSCHDDKRFYFRADAIVAVVDSEDPSKVDGRRPTTVILNSPDPDRVCNWFFVKELPHEIMRQITLIRERLAAT